MAELERMQISLEGVKGAALLSRFRVDLAIGLAEARSLHPLIGRVTADDMIYAATGSEDEEDDGPSHSAIVFGGDSIAKKFFEVVFFKSLDKKREFLDTASRLPGWLVEVAQECPFISALLVSHWIDNQDVSEETVRPYFDLLWTLCRRYPDPRDAEKLLGGYVREDASRTMEASLQPLYPWEHLRDEIIEVGGITRPPEDALADVVRRYYRKLGDGWWEMDECRSLEDFIPPLVDPEEGDASLPVSSEVEAIGKDGEILVREIFRGNHGSLLGELFSESETYRTPIEEVGIKEFGEPRRVGYRSCYVTVKDEATSLTERVPLFFALPLREGETADQRVRSALTWLTMQRLATQEAGDA